MHPPCLLGEEGNAEALGASGCQCRPPVTQKREQEEQDRRHQRQRAELRAAQGELERQGQRAPTPAQPGSLPAGSRARAGHIMLMLGQGLPGQSNALSDQRSTCWVVSWEGLGRKRLDWRGEPQAEGTEKRHRG